MTSAAGSGRWDVRPAQGPTAPTKGKQGWGSRAGRDTPVPKSGNRDTAGPAPSATLDIVSGHPRPRIRTSLRPRRSHMTERDHFLAAIRANPDDDGVRLVYADWLEEHGDSERAEFIRGQILLAGLDDEDPRWGALARRSDWLLARHGAEWAARGPAPGGRRVGSRRGHLEYIHCTAHAFISRGGGWAAAAPVRGVSLDRLAGRARQLTACRHCAALAELGLLGRRVDDEDVGAVLQSPHLSRLTALTVRRSFDGLAGTLVGDGTLRRLADGPLPALVRLRLASLTGFGAGSVARLLRSGAAPRLKRLH